MASMMASRRPQSTSSKMTIPSRKMTLMATCQSPPQTVVVVIFSASLLPSVLVVASAWRETDLRLVALACRQLRSAPGLPLRFAFAVGAKDAAARRFEQLHGQLPQ